MTGKDIKLIAGPPHIHMSRKQTGFPPRLLECCSKRTVFWAIVWVTWETGKPRTQPGERRPNAQSKDSDPTAGPAASGKDVPRTTRRGPLAPAGGWKGRTKKGAGWECGAGITAKRKSDRRWRGRGEPGSVCMNRQESGELAQRRRKQSRWNTASN